MRRHFLESGLLLLTIERRCRRSASCPAQREIPMIVLGPIGAVELFIIGRSVIVIDTDRPPKVLLTHQMNLPIDRLAGQLRVIAEMENPGIRCIEIRIVVLWAGLLQDALERAAVPILLTFPLPLPAAIDAVADICRLIPFTIEIRTPTKQAQAPEHKTNPKHGPQLNHVVSFIK
jgi:hypothetical protein